MRSSLVVLLILVCASPASAASFIVTSVADSGPGTLRAAMAELVPGQSHTIDFALPANAIIEVQSPLPVIQGSVVVIDGIGTPGLGVVAINGTRIFQTDPTRVTELTLRSFLIGNGVAEFGGCLSLPALSTGILQEMVFQNCQATGPVISWGGAVYSEGDLDVIDCEFINNVAFPSAGSTTNTSMQGGAIRSRRQLRVVSSRFIRNGVAATPPAVFAQGAAIFSIGNTDIRFSHFVENSVNGQRPNAFGTAYCIQQSCTVLGSSFRGNRGGALTVATQMSNVGNTSFIDNMAGPSLSVLPGDGPSRINNVTFVKRPVESGLSGAHIHMQFAQGQQPDVSISNSILGPTGEGVACLVPPFAAANGGYNVSVDSSCEAFANGTSRVISGDLGLLEPIVIESGLVEVAPLAPDSPAVDTGSTEAVGTLVHACLPTDARSNPRPEDGDNDGTAVCDVGAFERRSDVVLRSGFED